MKKWLLLASTLILVGCGETTSTEEVTSTPVETTEEVAVAEITVAVTVDGEPIEEGEQVLEVEEGAVLLDVMKEHYELDESGGLISAINGHEQDADAGKYWIFDVNGEMGEVGVAELELTDGDLVEWKLEAFEG